MFNYTIVINLDGGIIKPNEIKLINELILDNSMILLPNKLIILPNMNLSIYDIYGLHLLENNSGVDIYVIDHEKYGKDIIINNIDDYVITFNSKHVKQWCFYKCIESRTCKQIGVFRDEITIAPRLYKLCDDNDDKFDLYFTEYEEGSMEKILKIYKLISNITEDRMIDFRIQKIENVNFDGLFEIQNQFSFSKKSVVVFDDESLKDDDYKYMLIDKFDVDHEYDDEFEIIIKNQHKQTNKYDNLFNCDNFVLNLFMLYYEMDLPFEMVVIIFGYV